MGKLNGSNWIWFIVIAVIATFGARQCGRMSAEHLNEAELRPPSERLEPASKIFTSVTRQSSDGITEETMSSALVESIGEWMAERMYSNAVAKQVENSGVVVEKPSPETVIVETGGKRLGVIRFRSQGFTPAVTILGLDGADMVRVSCISNLIEDVAVSQGACAAKIKEVFGVSMAR